jgi:chromosome segregation ATPase
MAVRDHTLILVCDTDPVSPYTLQLDDADLRARAAQRGLRPAALLARYIREELGQKYALATTEQELETIADLLIDHGTNRARPLSVRKKTSTSMTTASADHERQLTDLQSRLQHALSALQQERAERKREREQYERDLADTRATLARVQAERDQHLRKIGEQTIQLEDAGDLQQQLHNAQRDNETLTRDREVFQDRVERQDEQLAELRGERDQLRDRAGAMQQELDTLRQQAQQLLHEVQYRNHVCALAFQQLMQLDNDRLGQLPAELHEAIEVYRRSIFYGPAAF